MKARRYERGLRSEVRHIVSSHALPTFRVVVKMAQTMTFSGLKVKVHGQQNDREREISRIRIGTKVQASLRDRINVPPSSVKCREPKYYVLQCQTKEAKVNDQANKGKVRVFTMTHEEAAHNSDVITGMLSISSIPVYVLIDSGTMHSFISEAR
ncbi:Pepsin-retropepsin like protein [Abeliophyllum distichum]|uniref:Pepsin-retropepsin like protein n=1 Tax=Abeliophyllum distichum TaxID=126358 RepID=A0ABD1NP67_9LAMI